MRIHADPDPSYPWFRINFFPDAKPISVSAWHEAGDGYEKFLCPRHPARWAGSRAGSPVSALKEEFCALQGTKWLRQDLTFVYVQ